MHVVFNDLFYTIFRNFLSFFQHFLNAVEEQCILYDYLLINEFYYSLCFCVNVLVFIYLYSVLYTCIDDFHFSFV